VRVNGQAHLREAILAVEKEEKAWAAGRRRETRGLEPVQRCRRRQWRSLVDVGDDDGDVLGLLRTRRGRRWRLDGSDTVERWLSLGQAQAQFGSQPR
jgi:hypothetical protein